MKNRKKELLTSHPSQELPKSFSTIKSLNPEMVPVMRESLSITCGELTSTSSVQVSNHGNPVGLKATIFLTIQAGVF
jgi:hypothetical protein